MVLSFKKNKNPINRIHFVGTSAVLTIDQTHVERLGIDDLTFFEEKPIQEGLGSTLSYRFEAHYPEYQATTRNDRGETCYVC
jgi:hypothetical protein